MNENKPPSISKLLEACGIDDIVTTSVTYTPVLSEEEIEYQRWIRVSGSMTDTGIMTEITLLPGAPQWVRDRFIERLEETGVDVSELRQK